jgi:hypothetical protein
LTAAAFYCVSDARYFLGAVGLINSLRAVGNDEPVFLLDCGLTGPQRKLLAAEAQIVDAPSGVPPWLLKTILPLAQPAAVQVLVDTDMIVTRPLGPLLDHAADGAVIAFRDRQQRFFEEWGELPGLGAARPRPYVSSGFVVLGGDLGGRVVQLFHTHQDCVDFELTFWRRDVPDYPYRYADQDVLNAVLATSVDPGDVEALDQRLAPTPPFRGLRVESGGGPRLECSYRDGTRPYLVHQYLRKPWLEETYDGAYSRLLRGLLNSPDEAIVVPGDQLPVRLRDDAEGRAARRRANARDFLRWHLGDRLPAPIATRVERRRRRREAAHA